MNIAMKIKLIWEEAIEILSHTHLVTIKLYVSWRSYFKVYFFLL
jgi:hypothetical protein